MDLNEYLKVINYEGSLNPDADTLTKICDLHSQTFPFDIFDMFGGKPKILSLEKIYNDMVVNKRGGFCYEQNGLLHWVLQEIGFKLDILQGQPYIKATDDYNPKFDHMCLMVTTNNGGKWLTDVGWGGSSFVLPLKFVEMEEQPQRNGSYRLRKNDESTYYVEKVAKRVIGGKKKNNVQSKEPEWQIVYRFDTTPHSWKDFDDMCQYQQESENSFLKYNTISVIQTKNGGIWTWGYQMCKKIYIDPYTEEVVNVVKAKDETEFKNMIKEEMGIELGFDLKLNDRDFTGFTEEQGCCTFKCDKS